MFTRYPHKILGEWTLGLYQFPRWISANARPTLTDPLTSPSTGTISSGSYTSFSPTIIPASWVLTSGSVLTPSILIERLFNSLSHEISLLSHATNQLSRPFFFDSAEPEYGLLVPILEESIDSVSIDSPTSGYIEIPEARSDLDLFWGATWAYRKGDGYIVIYGIGIQEMDSERRSGQGDWQFISSSSQWSSGSILFWEHPQSKTWIPIHPTQIRSDGFLNIYYDGTLRLRSVSTVSASSLSSLTVYINGETRTAQRINFWNSLDDKAIWAGIYRKQGESNLGLRSAVLLCSWFSGQDKMGVRDFVSSYLRQGSVQFVSPSATGFDLPANAVGYTVKDWSQYQYVYEKINEDVDTSSFYRSLYIDPEIGTCWYGNTTVDFSSVSGSVYEIDTHITNNKTYKPLFFWRLKYWTEDGSAVSFSSNFPRNQENLTVFFPEGVDLPDPDFSLQRKGYLKTSPTLRWKRSVSGVERVSGGSVFA